MNKYTCDYCGKLINKGVYKNKKLYCNNACLQKNRYIS